MRTLPIQFIPSKIPKARSGEEKASTKLIFPSGVIKTFRVFDVGRLEHVINHVRLVEVIIKDMQIKEQILAAEAELKEKDQELALLVPRCERPRSHIPASHRRYTEESPKSTKNSRASNNVSSSGIQTLKSGMMELKGKIKDLNESVFDTFKQTLAAPLQAPFRDIVKAQCNSADDVDLKGKHVQGAPCGRVLKAFKLVTISWLQLYADKEDIYKVTLRLIQNHILMNTDKVPVEAGVQRFKDLNKLLMWCPPRKHLPNPPKALPEPRELAEFELCTAVLASRAKHVLAHYNGAHGTAFACKLDQLTLLLKRSVDATQVNHNLLNQ